MAIGDMPGWIVGICICLLLSIVGIGFAAHFGWLTPSEAQACAKAGGIWISREQACAARQPVPQPPKGNL